MMPRSRQCSHDRAALGMERRQPTTAGFRTSEGELHSSWLDAWDKGDRGSGGEDDVFTVGCVELKVPGDASWGMYQGKARGAISVGAGGSPDSREER